MGAREPGHALAPREPTVVRLAVSYRSARSLVTEFTACLARGGCLLVTRREVPVGAAFRFLMECQELQETLEIEGEVVRVRPIHGEVLTYELAVQYRSRAAQLQLEALLARVGTDDTQQQQLVRRYSRVTVNLPAEDSQGLGRRYLIRDLSLGGMRLELVGSLEVAIGSRVLVGVRFGLHEPLVFLPGTLAWHRSGGEAHRLHLGVKFAELDGLTEPQRRTLIDLLRLRRPTQVYLHLAEPAQRNAQRVTLSIGHRAVEPELLGKLVSALARRELPSALGMAIVESDLTELVEESRSCQVQVPFSGDFSGELRLRASLELCAALAAQLRGDVVPLDDRQALGAALRDLAVSLASSVCEQLEARGHDVSLCDVALPEPLERVVSLSLAGMRGIAIVTMVAPRPASRAA